MLNHSTVISGLAVLTTMLDFRDLATSTGGQVQCQIVCDSRYSEPDDWRDVAEVGERYSRVGQGLVQPGTALDMLYLYVYGGVQSVCTCTCA